MRDKKFFSHLAVKAFSLLILFFFAASVEAAELNIDPDSYILYRNNRRTVTDSVGPVVQNKRLNQLSKSAFVGNLSDATVTRRSKNQRRSVKLSSNTNPCLKVDVPAGWECEPDYEVKINAVPNDTYYSYLWGMEKISAPTAWDTTTGISSIVVAVLDTGVDYTHSDLAANTISGGYDFVNDDTNPMDDHGHGTHCAGTIAGVGNNGRGVTGVAWGVTVLPVKVLDADGSGWTSDIIKGLDYAVENGAQISSLSLSTSFYIASLETAIKDAADKNHLVISAAGNSANNNDGSEAEYPASYSLDNIIAVAASDSDDNLASFSNYGATSVDLAAPGTSILSTAPGNDYVYMQGTSMATPHVAGAAALVWSSNPSYTYTQIRNALLNNVDKKSSLSGLVVSGGRLNVAAALASLPSDGGSGDDTVPPADGEEEEETVGPEPSVTLSASGARSVTPKGEVSVALLGDAYEDYTVRLQLLSDKVDYQCKQKISISMNVDGAESATFAFSKKAKYFSNFKLILQQNDVEVASDTIEISSSSSAKKKKMKRKAKEACKKMAKGIKSTL